MCTEGILLLHVSTIFITFCPAHHPNNSGHLISLGEGQLQVDGSRTRQWDNWFLASAEDGCIYFGKKMAQQTQQEIDNVEKRMERMGAYKKIRNNEWEEIFRADSAKIIYGLPTGYGIQAPVLDKSFIQLPVKHEVLEGGFYSTDKDVTTNIVLCFDRHLESLYCIMASWAPALSLEYGFTFEIPLEPSVWSVVNLRLLAGTPPINSDFLLGHLSADMPPLQEGDLLTGSNKQVFEMGTFQLLCQCVARTQKPIPSKFHRQFKSPTDFLLLKPLPL